MDLQKRTLYFPYHVDIEDDDFIPITDFDPAVSLTGLVVSERHPVLYKKEELEKRAQKGRIWGPVPLIWMGTPLIIEDEVIGVVAVQSYSDPDLYSEEDLKVLTAVSDQMASAIARKRAEEELLVLKRFNEHIVRNINEGIIITNKDGSIRCLETTLSALRDDSGMPVGILGMSRDITARRQADKRIRYLSYHDQLTGLYNRHFLEEEMKRLDTERQLPISIIIVDLNGLKLVNDTYGHQTGDEMLNRSAAVLKSVCREDDLLARFGGDEFVLYLPCTSAKEAQKICSRIEKACCKEQINDVPLSLAMGVAIKESAEQEIADLLREAENNMYRDKLTESRSGKSAIVNSLLQTLSAKSFETEAHTRNMQEAAKSIGKKLGLPHSELHRLQLLITLHDIGKINIPEELLTKKGSLSDLEWEIMKKHSETGFRIAKATENFAHVAEDILAHHERWDGSGYLQGLKGEEIPLLARITAIVDAYEVMSNGRPYKKAMSRSKIVAEFKNCSGAQFDSELVELFLEIIEADGLVLQ